MQITLNEQEIQEAVQQYIIGLGILAEGTSATVTLTGGGNGKTNAEYGATLEFSKTRPQVTAPAAPVKREVVEAQPEAVITPEPVSDKSEATPEVVADTSVGKSPADTPVSSQEPDITEENADNSPFKTVAEEGPKSRGVSLFNRDPA